MDIIISLTVVVLGILALIVVIFGIRKDSENKKKSISVFETLDDFDCTHKQISESSGVSIGYDGVRKKICILSNHKALIYECKDIIQSELDVDGETVLKQSISGTIGRSVVGGIFGGGVGAIIGGTTGSKKGKEKVKKIDLKITVLNTQNPVYRINFLNLEVKKGGSLYNMMYEKAEKWHGIISILIKQAEMEIHDKNLGSSNPNSVADELLKLKNLLDSKIITKDEFDTEKNKVLTKH